MNKQTFINSLRAKLSGLPKRDVEERLAFCRMLHADRIMAWYALCVGVGVLLGFRITFAHKLLKPKRMSAIIILYAFGCDCGRKTKPIAEEVLGKLL